MFAGKANTRKTEFSGALTKLPGYHRTAGKFTVRVTQRIPGEIKTKLNPGNALPVMQELAETSAGSQQSGQRATESHDVPGECCLQVQPSRPAIPDAVDFYKQ